MNDSFRFGFEWKTGSKNRKFPWVICWRNCAINFLKIILLRSEEDFRRVAKYSYLEKESTKNRTLLKMFPGEFSNIFQNSVFIKHFSMATSLRILRIIPKIQPTLKTQSSRGSLQILESFWEETWVWKYF